MTGDWRDWRPAIWLVMLGIAVMLLVSPFYFGALFIGAGIGASVRIRQRRRRAAVLPASTHTRSVRRAANQPSARPGSPKRSGRPQRGGRAPAKRKRGR